MMMTTTNSPPIAIASLAAVTSTLNRTSLTSPSRNAKEADRLGVEALERLRRGRERGEHLAGRGPRRQILPRRHGEIQGHAPAGPPLAAREMTPARALHAALEVHDGPVLLRPGRGGEQDV